MQNKTKIPHCRNNSKIPHCRNNSKIKYWSRRKRQNWHHPSPLTHKYMIAHLCGLVQRTLITQHKQRCSSRFFREVRVDHLFNFLCRVFLFVFVLRLVPYISCVSGLFILDYPSVFSHVVYVQGSVSSKTSQ